jgi:hypothetical protein
MLSETTLRACAGALDAAREKNEAALEDAVSFADGDLSNPVCSALIARKTLLQTAYGDVIRALESLLRERNTY